MSTEIKIPNLGENVASGDVLEILISEGDVIQKEQGVLELETDKATVIVPSTAAGVVEKIHVSEGDTVEVGAVVVTLGSTSNSNASGNSDDSDKANSAKPTSDASTLTESKTPAKSTADHGQAESSVAQPSGQGSAAKSDQTTRSESTSSSTTDQTSSRTEKEGQSHTSPSSVEDESPSAGGLVPAGPAIRRFAREVGVNLASVEGTGERGRITREDVLRVVRQGIPGKTQSTVDVPAGGASDGFGAVRTEKMPKIRQTIARKMHESWTTCPRVTNFDDADVTALEEIRQNSKKDYLNQGIKLTSMPFLIKAVAMSLKAHPIINASVDLEAGQIIYKDYINIGIAVDTERGLVVPVLRDADKLSIPAIARQLGELADSVRDNDFSVDQLRGGTFTISNLGAIGGTYSTPIINTPETAILLAGRARKMPVVTDNDQIAIRLMMPLSLAYDHRLIDGGAAARFLNDVIGFLEAPSRLLLAL